MPGRVGFAFAFVLLVPLLCCTPRRVPEDTAPREAHRQNTQYWNYDQKVRDIMDTLVQRQALEADQTKRERRAKETETALGDAAGYAQALAEAADGIRSAIQDAKMSRAAPCGRQTGASNDQSPERKRAGPSLARVRVHAIEHATRRWTRRLRLGLGCVHI